MRQCGDCQLCCKLLPVNSDGLRDDTRRVEVHKVAGERCRYQKHGKGCAVYAGRPLACELWTCNWLTGDAGTETMSRPDRSHYVIDVMTAKIVLGTNDGKSQTVTALQVWIDSKYPDAHRDPELRAYVEKKAMPAIIRSNSTEGFVLFPPGMIAPGWVEKESNIHPTQESFDKVLKEAI